MLPEDYPTPKVKPYTEEALAQEIQQWQEQCEQIGQRYQVAGWYALNRRVPMPWQEWLYMDDRLKRAIAAELEKDIQAQERAAREREQELKQQFAQQNAGIKFPHPTNSSINNLINR